MTSPLSELHQSRNFEEFAALLHGFDMDIRQLDRGLFSGSSHQVAIGKTILSHFVTKSSVGGQRRFSNWLADFRNSFGIVQSVHLAQADDGRKLDSNLPSFH